MMRRRHIGLMLTPLLDMLIIIIFAQLVEANRTLEEQVTLRREAEALRETAERDSAEATQARAEANATVAQLDAALADLGVMVDELEQEKANLQALAATHERVATDMTRAVEDLGTVFQAQFDVPPELLEQVIEGIDSEQDAERVREYMHQVSQANPAQAVRVARQMNELLKRAEFWDVYVDAADVVTLSTPEGVMLDGLVASNPETVRSRLQDAMGKTRDGPRMVITILSYHPESTYDAAQWVRDALEMSSDYLDRRRMNTSHTVSDFGVSEERP